MQQTVDEYAQALYQVYFEADQKQADRLNRWRSIEPESAQLLSVLISAKQAHNILEIGTSGGYSTLWLADAAKHIAGRVVTLEIDAARVETALQHLKATNLADVCTVCCIDAAVFLRENQEAFDFILLDAERPAYVNYWPDLKRCLRQAGSLMVVDNVISHADQVQDFIEQIQSDCQFKCTVLPVGAGLLLVVKT